MPLQQVKPLTLRAKSVLFNFSSTDAGKYELMATNELGTSKSIANLKVLPVVNEDIVEESPLFTSPLKDTIVNEGADLELTARFSGNPVPEIYWKKNGETMESDKRVAFSCDSRSATLRISPADLSDTAQYACFLANPLGEAESACELDVQKVYQAPQFIQK